MCKTTRLIARSTLTDVQCMCGNGFMTLTVNPLCHECQNTRCGSCNVDEAK
jgi:hypothetical protein